MNKNNEFRRNNQKKWINKKSVNSLIAICIVLIIFTTSGCSLEKNSDPTVLAQTTKTDPTTSSKSTQVSSIKSTEDQKPTESNSVVYENTKYGFTFTLPVSWKGYTIVTDTWKSTVKDKGTEESGEIIYIRHPEWKENNQRQDIPIYVLTLEQWNLLQKEKIALSAAPFIPDELGRNSKYVFALPARYNYSFYTGFEEVEQIFNNKPLKANEKFK